MSFTASCAAVAVAAQKEEVAMDDEDDDSDDSYYFDEDDYKSYLKLLHDHLMSTVIIAPVDIVPVILLSLCNPADGWIHCCAILYR